MGVTEDGTPIDIHIDALGCLGRLNSGQCFEQELNWVADTVQKNIKETDDIDKKFKLLFKYLKIVNPEEYEKYKEYVANLSEEERLEEINEIESDRIYILQSPIYCATDETLQTLYNEFKPELSKIYYKDENGEMIPALRKMIVADEYIIRLKQEPITKFSCRSKSMVNPRSGLPLKSTRAGRHRIVHSDQCNRLGEQELSILMLSKDYDALDYFFRSYSASIEGRRATDLFEKDPSKGFIINTPSESSRAVEMLNAYLKAIGYEINIQYTKNSDDDVLAECDIPKIPDYITKIM